MITQKRLEELIKQNKVVYAVALKSVTSDYICDYIIKDIQLDSSADYFYKDNKLYERVLNKPKFRPVVICSLNNLYETKEEAEWELVKNVSKTETLTFPAYKEVLKNGFDKSFFVEYNNQIIQYYFLVSEIDNKIQFFFREIEHVMLTDAYDCTLELPLTEENYKRACKLVTKFFTEEYNLSNIGDQE